jgi:hypothetical protein
MFCSRQANTVHVTEIFDIIHTIVFNLNLMRFVKYREVVRLQVLVTHAYIKGRLC